MIKIDHTEVAGWEVAIRAKNRERNRKRRQRKIMEAVMGKKLLEMGFCKEEASGETRYTSDSMGVQVIVGKHGVRMESDHGIPQAVFEAVSKAEKVGVE